MFIKIYQFCGIFEIQTLVLKFYQNFHFDFLKFLKFLKDHAEKSKLVPYDIMPLKRDHFLNTEFPGRKSRVVICDRIFHNNLFKT